MKLHSLLLIIFAVVISPFSKVCASSGVMNTLEFSVTTTSQMVLGADTQRSYLLIQNKGATDIYYKTASASSGTSGVKIIAGGYYEPVVAPIDKIYLKSSSGTNAVTVVVGIK